MYLYVCVCVFKCAGLCWFASHSLSLFLFSFSIQHSLKHVLPIIYTTHSPTHIPPSSIPISFARNSSNRINSAVEFSCPKSFPSSSFQLWYLCALLRLFTRTFFFGFFLWFMVYTLARGPKPPAMIYFSFELFFCTLNNERNHINSPRFMRDCACQCVCVCCVFVWVGIGIYVCIGRIWLETHAKRHQPWR